MILTEEELLLFHKCIGTGNISTADVIIFGNEFGSAGGMGGGTQACVSKFMSEFKTKKLFQIGEGFTQLDIDSPPVSSTFLQFISRLVLALKYKDERFFGTLTSEGKIFLNNFRVCFRYFPSTNGPT